MRLYEFAPWLLMEAEAQPPRDFVATTRFISNFQSFSHKYRDLEPKMRDFMEFRRMARPDQPYNAKDNQMVNDSVRGLRRCHLVHGKALILYFITRNEIQLLDVVEHNEIEGRNMIAMSRYIVSLTPQSFKPFSLPDQTSVSAKAKPVIQKTLSNDQKEKLITVFKMMADQPSDRPILDSAARGDIADLIEWARYALDFQDNSHDNVIIQALGGRAAVAKWARIWIDTADKRQRQPQ